jgi:hypothetical protein
LELAAGDGGVVIKELVKISHPEKEKGVWIFALGRRPLSHEGRQFGSRLFGNRRRKGKHPGLSAVAGGYCVLGRARGGHGFGEVSDHAAFKINPSARLRSFCILTGAQTLSTRRHTRR